MSLTIYLKESLPLYSTPTTIEEEATAADVVVGAVLILESSLEAYYKDLVKEMKHGSVIVDVAIDQGGCSETSRPTTHSDPVYVHDEVVHYCVANMPGACARTATFALTNSVLPYALHIAELGVQKLFLMILFPRRTNICHGKVTNEHSA